MKRSIRIVCVISTVIKIGNACVGIVVGVAVVSGVPRPIVAVVGSVLIVMMIVTMIVAVYMVLLGMVSVTFVATVMVLTTVRVVSSAVGIIVRVIMSLGVGMAPV